METVVWPWAPGLRLAGRADELAGVQADSDTREIALFLTPVAAGFPSPADDCIEERLDLHRHVVRNPLATFFLHASGDSMINVGIHDGDLLVVDRSIEAAHNRVVIAAVEGELTVKRLFRKGDRVLLMPENPAYAPLDITEREYVHIWGVVTYVIHRL